MKATFYVFIGIVIFVSCGLYSGMRAESSSEEEITVISKEAVNSGDSYKYLIFTDSEVFEVSDEMVIGHFSSSDTYNRMQIGQKYKVRVMGWRISFLSWYRNIVEVKPL